MLISIKIENKMYLPLIKAYVIYYLMKLIDAGFGVVLDVARYIAKS